MSVAIIFNQKPIDDWFDKLAELLPETKVEIYPEIENPNDVEFIVTWKPHVGYVNEFPNLKVVQSVGAGIDHLLHTPIPSTINITRIVDPALKHDMFEHVLTCVLTSIKNILPYYKAQLEKNWRPTSYKTIAETTVTILGLGEIGKDVATKFVNLGFTVKGWSNSPKNIEGVESFSGLNELENAISQTDFIINILPLTAQTEGILNEQFFEFCSDNTVLINVGRGGHLVENDLLTAIKNNKIKEAYLDVFIEEPLPENHPFWTNSQVYVTPHIASMTNANTALEQVADNYKRMKNEETLINQVSMERGY
ncbi:glyoxylate/hydroxypyruvate reductase A [Algoriella sp.]|uniref:2-hydroxyacid dehydrogenase n=1 Tax=Algoriella sp. TaxID=1872434 RepID=UPI001B065552|nr:glyoxylate/hydroxypyruvate reductase A [Algoriella sp.]MBO6211970.1 glyoxylate/hydroxypyruvate reductase A [Algoriella sp.]